MVGMKSDDETLERLKRIEEKLEALEKRGGPMGRYYGYEYKSKKMIFGMPLIHIAQGFDPETGRMRVARGFIAVGNVAIGVFSLGGVALGVFAFGGFSLGLVVFGGAAIGILLGIGGLATGCIALGGMAIGYYAIGGGAVGVHTVSGAGADPELANRFRFLLDYFRTPPGR